MHPNTATEFIESIRLEQSKGAQFVPLTGAGFSADSGIICGKAFISYLCYAAYRYFEGWNIRIDGWPPMPGNVERSASAKWWEDIKADPASLVQAEALLIAARDWRTLLKFLASVRLRHAAIGDSRLRNALDIAEPDDNVLVSFIDFLSRGKRPNTGHRLLAQLAEPLRVRLTLTTNFDALQEHAFQESRLPVDVFEVPNGVELPSSIAVGRSNTLVKLHGGRVNARADHSLDEDPSTSNREAFRRYFGLPGALSAPKHLLVMGFSAHDRRILRLIAEALVTQPRMKVFWVAHTNEDCNAERLLENSIEERIQEWPDLARQEKLVSVRRRIQFCVARADEVLQGVYLALTLTLPARTGEWALDDRATEIRPHGGSPYLQIACCSAEQEPAYAVLASELTRRLGRPAWWEAIPSSMDQFVDFARMAGDDVHHNTPIMLCQYGESGEQVDELLGRVEPTALRTHLGKCHESELNEARLVERISKLATDRNAMDFLLVLSLCKRPLHRAILYTEAALRDVDRYGLNARDNCKWRAEQVAAWLDELGQGLRPGNHIVDQRPSGTVWVTRAARIVILKEVGPVTTGTRPIVHLKLAKAYERLYRYSRSLEYLVEAQCHLRDALTDAHDVLPSYAESPPDVLQICRSAFAREALVRLARLVLLWEERGRESPFYSGREPPWPLPPSNRPEQSPSQADLSALFDCLWPSHIASALDNASARADRVRAFIHERGGVPDSSSNGEPSAHLELATRTAKEQVLEATECADPHGKRDTSAPRSASHGDGFSKASLQASFRILRFSVDRTIEELFEQANECRELRIELHRWIESIGIGTLRADWKLLQLLERLRDLQTFYIRRAEGAAVPADHADAFDRSIIDRHLASSSQPNWRLQLACVAKVGRTIEELCGVLTFESLNRSFKHELTATRHRAEALAQMGRYCEAHNLTNRAFGLLTNSHLSHVDALWGRLDRTRGAIHLWEALTVFGDRRQRRDNSEWHGFVLSLLDDAWIAFERAEPCLRRSRALVRLRVYQVQTIAALQELEQDYRARAGVGRVQSFVDHTSGSRCHTALDLIERFLRHPTRLRNHKSAVSEMLGLGRFIGNVDANPGSLEHKALLAGLERLARDWR